MIDKIKIGLNNIFGKPEIIFLVLGVIFGFLFLILTPPFEVPDETGHLHRAIEVSNGIFWNKVPAKVSEIDKVFMNDSSYSREFKIVGKNFHFQSGYAPVMYMFSALGIKTGWIFKNTDLMFYLARVFNLFVWLALIYAAIKITPVFKWQFMFFALLPMSVFEGMSVSADSFVNGFSFLFFAYMFKLIFEAKERLTLKELLLYGIFAVISSLLKGCLIYPVFLLLLVKDKRKYFIAAAVLAVSVLIGGLWAFNNHVVLGPEAMPDECKRFLINEPFRYFLLAVKTMILSSIYWFKGLIGILGTTDVRYPLGVYVITGVVSLSSFFFIQAEKKISIKSRVLAAGLIFLFFMIMLTTLFVTWNNPLRGKIGGFQGRYIISVLPLFFLLLARNSKFKYETYYKLFLLIFLGILLIYSCFFITAVY